MSTNRRGFLTAVVGGAVVAAGGAQCTPLPDPLEGVTFKRTWRDAMLDLVQGDRVANVKFVMLVISMHFKTDGTGSSMSHQQLAHLTSLHVDTVRRCIRKAEQWGWLTKQVNAGFATARGRQNLYSPAIPPTALEEHRQRRLVAQLRAVNSRTASRVPSRAAGGALDHPLGGGRVRGHTKIVTQTLRQIEDHRGNVELRGRGVAALARGGAVHSPVTPSGLSDETIRALKWGGVS